VWSFARYVERKVAWLGDDDISAAWREMKSTATRKEMVAFAGLVERLIRKKEKTL